MWHILVFEMIIAAPLWAISHGMVEGEGVVGQSAKQGYLLFLRAALQPAVMVIAFWLALVACATRQVERMPRSSASVFLQANAFPVNVAKQIGV